MRRHVEGLGGSQRVARRSEGVDNQKYSETHLRNLSPAGSAALRFFAPHVRILPNIPVMMRWAVPLSLLALSYVLLAGYVWISYASLPAKVASHFDLGGEPNGWMSRDMCVELTLGLGVLLPGVILAMMAARGKSR